MVILLVLNFNRLCSPCHREGQNLIGAVSSGLSAVGSLVPVLNLLFGIFNTYLPYSNQAHTKQRKGSVTSKLPNFLTTSLQFIN
ncbi:hypothetical protein SAMN04488104_10671 [Algoriphagus faecimaris]|uniref:Uncharacterized protein n=1 Tax=Algoriphagus faecimaris TaxID=686796 RepID=A0A1G6XSZ2_9BACT|nr:hypothetical protein SAMN04488104_10671 [Algoriphagus faecimaris]